MWPHVSDVGPQHDSRKAGWWWTEGSEVLVVVEGRCWVLGPTAARGNESARTFPVTQQLCCCD